MKIVPVIRCRDMSVSLNFYTTILGFKTEERNAPANPVVNIYRNGAWLQLSVLDGDSVYGTAINVIVEDVDTLFEEFVAKGLDTAHREDSPVHTAPVNQTWGTREFYVTDPDGNTLRFVQPLT